MNSLGIIMAQNAQAHTGAYLKGEADRPKLPRFEETKECSALFYESLGMAEKVGLASSEVISQNEDGKRITFTGTLNGGKKFTIVYRGKLNLGSITVGNKVRVFNHSRAARTIFNVLRGVGK